VPLTVEGRRLASLAWPLSFATPAELVLADADGHLSTLQGGQDGVRGADGVGGAAGPDGARGRPGRVTF
jgi:hypothetical protein